MLREIAKALTTEKSRETVKNSAKTDVVRANLCSSSSKLSVGAKLGIQSIIRILLILISTCRRHDKAIVGEILDLSATLLGQAPILSMSHLLADFSSDIGESLQPLIAFVRDIAMSSEDGDGHGLKAVQILMGLALARGSLPLMLSVVDLLLHKHGDGHDSMHTIMPMLKALFEHRIKRDGHGNDGADGSPDDDGVERTVDEDVAEGRNEQRPVDLDNLNQQQHHEGDHFSNAESNAVTQFSLLPDEVITKYGTYSVHPRPNS